MAGKKRNPTPDDIAEIRAALADVRREVAKLIEFLQQKLGEKPA
jgi:hypothetical protein